jgi:hypothetical protein
LVHHNQIAPVISVSKKPPSSPNIGVTSNIQYSPPPMFWASSKKSLFNLL